MKVYGEIEQIRRKLGVSKWMCRPKKMKYCFRERKVIPFETEYLQVRYGYQFDPIDPENSGETYEAVLGSRSSALELLLLDKDIMGPCWIRVPYEIKKEGETNKYSWCKLEIELEDSYDRIEVAIGNFQSPDLKILSLSLQTTLDEKNNTKLHVYVHVFTIKKIDLNPFPYNLENELKEKQFDINRLKTFGTETEMLNYFSAELKEWDCDIIVGHKLFDFVLDVLFDRMDKLRTKHWSRIGRLRRLKMPFLGGRLMKKSLGCGRLLCDTFLSAQEFIHQNTYTLSHLVKTQLGISNYQNIDINKIKEYWLDGKQLAEIIRHCIVDGSLIAKIMFKLQILPLTKALTILCGNVWQRSLISQRAERNEYLLLHEFHRAGFITPEKYTMNEKFNKHIIDENYNDNDNDNQNKNNKKKEKNHNILVV
ncbi:DNA-directed DNA polymerase alpha 1 [Reticulomyxa filosa]|uniref:DNA-directed DNA polymerase alpha 1 n=1 Tax=Reticulomyxa filosa TaxID=46433 RepID=X6M517_RETFI|nr:DNA-directed DNA polymerase alpha 1 [Reticulomyxa filosa]|eukprot:ETO08557.1 DNA-directed DNA polymerase alpha 1 [Reticulomyxa filosa]